MEPPVSPILFAVLLFIGMLVLLETGRRFGLRRRPEASESEESSLGTIETAVFALFGLVVAFTFSSSISRFNDKRELIAMEANSIDTAYLRLQLLTPLPRSELQDLFRRYVDSRLEAYRKLPNMIAAQKEATRYKQLQDEIWMKAISASQLRGAHPDAGKLLLPALNNMIDVTTTRAMALHNHPPVIIFGLLFILGLICSLLAGYRMAAGHYRSWLHILSFTVITVIVIYVIADIEYPRTGLIRLENFDQVLLELRQSMN